MSCRSARSPAGFSLVELLLATVVLLIMTGAVLGLLDPAAGTFATQPAVADLQQRLRVATWVISADLAQAGAGAYTHSAAGGLGDHLAPILPYRTGLLGADSPGTFRDEVLTVMYASAGAAQSRVRGVRPDDGLNTAVEMRSGCGGARHDLHCGFRSRMQILLLDGGGKWDLRTIAFVEGEALYLDAGPPLSSPHDTGDTVAVEVESYTYHLKIDRAAGTSDLMRYDGMSTDLPVVDNVVRLQFRYWGAAAPPQFVAGVPADERRTTYGPSPPPVGTPSGTTWPAGENCTFAVVDGAHVPRLPPLPGDSSGLVELDGVGLSDGPWCPDAARVDRFDADLLRVRRVQVVVRVQAGIASFRGPASSLFMYGGTARPSRYVPDAEVSFDVSPRNMGPGR